MALLFTLPRVSTFDLAGELATSSRLYFYLTGTSAPQTVYADAALQQALPQPVTASDAGTFPTIYLDESLPSYKVVCKDANDTDLWTVDPYLLSPSATALGTILYPRSDQEEAAGVIISPANVVYEYGTLERYGVVGDGSTDDSAAFAKAVLVANQGVRLLGSPGKTYLFASQVTPGATFDIDWRGATVKPSGDHLAINSGPVTVTVSVAVSGAISQGSRSLTVSSASGLTVGMWTYIAANDAPANQATAYPASWAKITNIASTTITFDRTFQCAYPSGSATLNAITDSNMRPICRMKGLRLDGSASTYSGAALGRGLRLVGYKVVDVEVDLVNWNTSSTTGDLAVAVTCLTVNWKINAVGNVTGSQHSNTFDCAAVKYIGGTIDGDGFGIAMTRCDSAIAMGNSLNGRRKQNSDDAVSPTHSVRGIKAYGCQHTVISGNEIADYESPIKVEACHRFIVSNNMITNAGLEASYTGSVAINIGQATDGDITGYGTVVGNVLENCGGIGIGITASSTVGRNVVTGNVVKSVQGTAIYTVCRNTIITNNQIADWGLRNSSDPAIYIDSGATITGNRFYHATLTSLPCIRNELDAGFLYCVKDNSPEDGNPLGLVMENSGSATIASGATSVVVTHGVSRTPQVTEFALVQGGLGTNDPGNLHLSAIGATTFTINCRADPGASGVTVGWRIVHPLLA